MKYRSRPLLALVALAALCTAAPTPAAEPRPVDIVFCLDVSGSMDPMLDEVRARLWDVVNEFSDVTPQPRVRLGLMVFGSAKAGPQAGFAAVMRDLTPEIDDVYVALMALETSGDKEYVGWAIHTAVEKISWSDDPDAVKMLLVAGNEPADQASEQYDFLLETRDALQEDIVVHALYAGSSQKAVEHRWNEIAAAGRGRFVAVRPSPDVVRLATPLDATIEELNVRYIDTFLPLGSRGKTALESMRARDEQAAKMGAQSFASRVATKAGGLDGGRPWDLVEASEDPAFDLAAVDAADLPAELRYASYADLVAIVEQKRAERAELRAEILAADAERRESLRKQTSRRGQTSVVDAMRDAVREQAESAGFSTPDRGRKGGRAPR